MIISIVIVEGAKQIMMTPETDHERQALKFIGINDELKVVSHWGSFGGISEGAHARLKVDKCQGGYLRTFSDKDSLMFLIEDKSNKS